MVENSGLWKQADLDSNRTLIPPSSLTFICSFNLSEFPVDIIVIMFSIVHHLRLCRYRPYTQYFTHISLLAPPKDKE